MGAEEGDYHVASDALLEAVRPPEDPGETPGEARVREVALEWRLDPSVAVAGHDSVDDTLEGRVGRSEGRELPEQGLEDWGRHGQDAAEGRTGGGPSEDGAPVAPRLDAGGPGSAQRGDDAGECVVHVLNGAGGAGRQGRNHRLPVVKGAVEG